MRTEFRFRSWNSETNKMFYDFDQDIKEVGLGRSIHQYVYETGLIYDTLMQFTGFPDSKGNSIYQGDILSDYTETDEGLKKSHCQVFWCEKKGMWRLDCSMKQDRSHSYPLHKELKKFKYEISGNVHQNPELLAREIEVNL